MISFDFDRSGLLGWLIIVSALALLSIQAWLVFRNDSLTPQRKTIRFLLNLLLWLVVVGYGVEPNWTVTANTTHALLVSDDVPTDYRQKVSDSLHIREVVTARTFKSNRFDSVTVLGQDFSPELLSRLSRQTVRWLPYYAPDQIQTISWKGIVQKGEMQQVTGTLESSRKQRIKLTYGGRTLDSLDLPVGLTSFTLQFPAFTVGRTETELVLDRTLLDTIRFFAQPLKPLTFQFILDTPDFESRTLADWLGKNGHSVQVTTTLSKDVSNRLTINKASAKPDVIVTDPSNAANVAVKRAVADGKAVLFINLTNPDADCRLINQALGSRWQVRKISNESLVPVGTGLQALPYVFTANVAQTNIPGYPAAVQQTSGKVGVSLLNETFPLKLSGDSLAYNRIWNAMLAQLRPASLNSSYLEAPVLKGLREAIYVNNPSMRKTMIQIGNDTVKIAYSPINPLSAEGKWLVDDSGWLSVQDSLAIYSESTGFPTVAKSRLVQQYMLAHHTDQSNRPVAERVTTITLPNWVWLTLFLFCLTALWLEPKLGG
ncbi:hypothetical protein WBJ53_16655 [Spirosoma sp. SC4-14]|uniref:hypothetical protein n=1 Tax=Spirosoma sp. SC4-14 TaxID=3128900 RepID=UPI0030D11FD9